MIVINASALIAFFLRGEGWREIVPYMIQTVSIDHVVKEFYNAPWKNVNLTKTITIDDTREIIELFIRLL